jgi:hypothetical protein
LPQLPAWPAVDGTTAGVVVGIAHPSYHSALTVMRRLQAGGAPRLNPGAVPHSTSNSTASWLAIRTGVAGLNATVATGDCAGLDAAAFAAGEVRCGRLATAMVAGACGWGEELWRALGRAGRTGVAEACGALWLDRSPDGALAEVAATAAAFDPMEPAVASRRCGVEALGGAGLEVADLVIGSRLGPGYEDLGAASMSLAPVLGDTLAAGGTLAAALAADRIAAGEIGSALVLATSPEGYASALVLVAAGAPRALRRPASLEKASCSVALACDQMVAPPRSPRRFDPRPRTRAFALRRRPQSGYPAAVCRVISI